MASTSSPSSSAGRRRKASFVDADVKQIAQSYQAGGAVAMSVLTEEDYFSGSIDDLRL